MQKFLSLLFSRRALAVVGVLVLALLVWFVGPLVSFDTLRPLASVGSRVVTIALLLMLLVLWLVNWSMSIIGISVLCLAIGFVTPLLALGDVHPFAPLWVRLTLIGFILLMYALYGLYRLWRALRMDEQLLRRFLHPRGKRYRWLARSKPTCAPSTILSRRPSGNCGSCGWTCPAGVKSSRENAFCMSCRGSWWSAVPAMAKPRPC